ncbi:hypothetical protein ACFE04_024138 [Oxalis oulophora]
MEGTCKELPLPKYPERSKSPTEAGKASDHEPVFEFKKQRSFNSRGEGSTHGAGRQRFNCLCSPTTHVGSFRCRHHRGLGGLGMTRGGSVGSNLSMLAAKSGHISNSLQAQ